MDNSGVLFDQDSRYSLWTGHFITTLVTLKAMKIIDAFQWHMPRILIRNQCRPVRLKKTSEAEAFTIAELITTEWLATTYGVNPCPFCPQEPLPGKKGIIYPLFHVNMPQSHMLLSHPSVCFRCKHQVRFVGSYCQAGFSFGGQNIRIQGRRHEYVRVKIYGK